MLRVTFIPPTEEEFQKLFSSTVLKNGGGLNDITIFQPPVSRKRGGGILSALSGIARKIFPFLLKSARQPAKELGMSVMKDVITGRRKLKDSLKRNGVKALKRTGRNILKGSGKINKGYRKREKLRAAYKRSVFDLV